MDTIIKNYLEQLKVGRKQSYKTLASTLSYQRTLQAWNTCSSMRPSPKA